jgi:transcription elongation GreA/GreB family factor
VKQKIIEAFIAHFEIEIAALIASAKAAHAAATHEESRAEDRHDTFAIEASYLAAGQAKRVQEIRASLNELNDFLAHLQPKSAAAIDLGALVTLESEGKQTYSLIARFGGGTQVDSGGAMVSLLSPTSPLGEGILGLQKGEQFSMESRTGTRNFLIIHIA